MSFVIVVTQRGVFTNDAVSRRAAGRTEHFNGWIIVNFMRRQQQEADICFVLFWGHGTCGHYCPQEEVNSTEKH